jgi:LysM repeat protein
VNQKELRTRKAGRTPHMTIKVEGSDVKITLPYSPQAGTMSNLGRNWQEIERSGLENLLAPGPIQRTALSYQLFVGGTENDRSITPTLNLLESIARKKKRLQVVYSTWESGYYQINSLAVTVLRRSSQDNEPTQATVDITFISAQQRKLNIGPVTGGVSPGGSGSGGSTSQTYREYVVRKGDTLTSIAIVAYGDASKWTLIAKVNHIQNPRDLNVGRKLVLPPYGTE